MRSAFRRAALQNAATLRAVLLLCALAAFAVPAARAEDAPIVVDEDALFGDADSGVETVKEEETGAAVKTFLKTDTVRIGGAYAGTLDASWTWIDPWNDGLGAPDRRALTPEADAKVFFDGRPNEQTRFYGAAKIHWPYADDSDFSVFELFADFSWNDALYFRFGKHTVKWGVGYFWSPADVLNVGAIDVADPTAQREGPVSLRLHIPVSNTQNNFWAYAIVPQAADAASAAALEPEDLALAAKYEFVLGGWEIGAGGFYRRDLAPKAMVTATGSLSRFNLFGEAVAAWGSDKEWYTDIADDTYEIRTAGLYFSGTFGFSYLDSTNNFSAYVQYFYNGNGYDYAERNSLIETASAADLLTLYKIVPGSGQHYAGIALSKAEAGFERLTLSVLAIANLSDLSGFVRPTASWRFFDGCSLMLSPTFVWATDLLWGSGGDGEYALMAGGASVTISIVATLGSGSF